ncbi:hypothetical protein [Rhizobium sp. Root483D2]|uniref:hypothetical protein n=1 Tax=Rhizobium sp. Root483D2 TaxID=1736545 RepID=UPI000713869A|nr:hypothetical protein [Rhizobium sp. Root483D2]KQY20254.1 hypothetical protein ASD32_07255 [Rhizobium sp. Root483D2]
MSNVVSIQDHQERVWLEYVAAQSRAQQSQSMKDGIAAGRAWRKWLALFMSDDQRSFVGDDRRHSA